MPPSASRKKGIASDDDNKAVIPKKGVHTRFSEEDVDDVEEEEEVAPPKKAGRKKTAPPKKAGLKTAKKKVSSDEEPPKKTGHKKKESGVRKDDSSSEEEEATPDDDDSSEKEDGDETDEEDMDKHKAAALHFQSLVASHQKNTNKGTPHHHDHDEEEDDEEDYDDDDDDDDDEKQTHSGAAHTKNKKDTTTSTTKDKNAPKKKMTKSAPHHHDDEEEMEAEPPKKDDVVTVPQRRPRVTPVGAIGKMERSIESSLRNLQTNVVTRLDNIDGVQADLSELMGAQVDYTDHLSTQSDEFSEKCSAHLVRIQTQLSDLVKDIKTLHTNLDAHDKAIRKTAKDLQASQTASHATLSKILSRAPHHHHAGDALVVTSEPSTIRSVGDSIARVASAFASGAVARSIPISALLKPTTTAVTGSHHNNTTNNGKLKKPVVNIEQVRRRVMEARGRSPKRSISTPKNRPDSPNHAEMSASSLQKMRAGSQSPIRSKKVVAPTTPHAHNTRSRTATTAAGFDPFPHDDHDHDRDEHHASSSSYDSIRRLIDHLNSMKEPTHDIIDELWADMPLFDDRDGIICFPSKGEVPDAVQRTHIILQQLSALLSSRFPRFDVPPPQTDLRELHHHRAAYTPGFPIMGSSEEEYDGA